MSKKNKVAIAVLSLLPLFAYAAKPEASLSQCQYWKDKIDYYTDLRRKGGSASRMESWRSTRREYKEKYNDYECDGWGRKIK